MTDEHFRPAFPGHLQMLAQLTDPADPYPAELVGQLSRSLLAITERMERMRAVLVWLDEGGGLGADVHKRIRDALSPAKERE